jgi:hypothetical protein
METHNFVESKELGEFLKNVYTTQNVYVKSIFDMDEEGRMLKYQRRGRNFIDNPYLHGGLKEHLEIDAKVCFYYRRSFLAENVGNWIQAVIINHNITALACHKGDIKVDDRNKCIADQRAILDEFGTVKFIVPDPKFYLRCEPFKTHAQYFLPNGDEVEREELRDYLPKRYQASMLTIDLDHIFELRIGGKIWLRINNDHNRTTASQEIKR